MTDTELALFLVRAAGFYNEQQWLRLDTRGTQEAIGALAQPDLLSVRAIAAIVGCSEGRVRSMWPLDQPMTKHRGTLDPKYLGMIGYLLSGVHLDSNTIDEMLNVCAVSMVARLTNKSDDTLQRWRKR